MSVGSCPMPDPSYNKLVNKLGSYQANKILQSYSATNRELPAIGSQDLDKLISFWKANHGYEKESPAKAKKRIMAKFGKVGTNSLIHPQFFAQATNMIREYSAMKGRKLIDFHKINEGGMWRVYLVRPENSYAVDANGFRANLDYDQGQGDNSIQDYSIALTPKAGDNKFKILVTTYYNKRTDIGRQITELRNNRRVESDPVKKVELSQKIDDLQNKLAEIDLDIKAIKAERAVLVIVPYLDNDLDEISQFINSSSDADPDLVTFQQLEYARKILRSWEVISNYSNPDHPFLDSFEKSDPVIKARLDSIFNRTIPLIALVDQIALKKVAKDASIQRGRTITTAEIKAPVADTNIIAANTLSLGRQSPLLLQVINEKINHVQNMSFQEYSKTEKEFSLLLNKAYPTLKSLNKDNPFSLFKQTVIYKGVEYETGNIVFRFSQTFFDEQHKLAYRARSAKDKNKSKAYKDLFKWQKDNIIYIDPSKMSDDSYINELERHYGSRGLEDLIERVKKMQETYEIDLASHKIFLEGQYPKNSKEYLSLLQEYEAKFDPKNFINNLSTPTITSVAGVVIYPTSKYIETIPKRYKDDGSLTSHYDSKFDLIQLNEDIYNFHKKMMDMLITYKKFVPYELGQDIQINSIPNISKTMFELYGEEGFQSSAAALVDQFKMSNTTNEVSDFKGGLIDPLTNSLQPSLAFTMRFDTKESLRKVVDSKVLEYKARGIKITKALTEQIRYEAADEISKSKSWDLGKIMKIYSFNTIQYKNKARVEDLLRWEKRIFDEKTPQLDTSFGKVMYDRDGKPIYDDKERLKNYRAALDHTMNFFLNLPIRDKEGVSDKKLYDAQDTKELNRLKGIISTSELSFSEGKISQSERDAIIDQANKEIESLGGNVTWSKVGDNLLRYFQIKGMGWNIFGGVINVAFGMISNMITAADGREFNEGNFWQAFRIASASTANNYTFNLSKNSKLAVFQDALKLRNLMDKNNILKEASHEMFKRTDGDVALTDSGSIAKRLKFLSPYNPQQRSEYLVQSMVLSAMMMSKRNFVTDLNGEQRPLWDAFTKEGDWNYDEFGVQENWEYDGKSMLNFIGRVESVIAESHGDYANPLAIKKSLFGRAISQFRTWMFEGYANRFETEKFDEIRGYSRKGRYRSFDRMSATMAASLLGTSIAPGIGTIIGGAAGYLGARFMNLDNASGMTDAQAAIFHTKQLFRRLLIKQNIGDINLEMEYDSSKGFTEVDAANMRKNMSEIAIYIYLYAFGLMLKGFADDDDPDYKLVVNYLINQGNRLETDIMFYTNPMEGRKLVKQIIPAMTLIEDVGQWFDAVYRQFDGRSDIQSGPFKGENILLKETLEGVPLGTQYYKMRRNVDYVLDM